MAKNLSIFSFFAGSGLLDLGFEDNSFNIVFVNEFFKPFLNAYQFVREKTIINSQNMVILMRV